MLHEDDVCLLHPQAQSRPGQDWSRASSSLKHGACSMQPRLPWGKSACGQRCERVPPQGLSTALFHTLLLRPCHPGLNPHGDSILPKKEMTRRCPFWRPCAREVLVLPPLPLATFLSWMVPKAIRATHNSSPSKFHGATVFLKFCDHPRKVQKPLSGCLGFRNLSRQLCEHPSKELSLPAAPETWVPRPLVGSPLAW